MDEISKVTKIAVDLDDDLSAVHDDLNFPVSSIVDQWAHIQQMLLLIQVTRNTKRIAEALEGRTEATA